MRSGDLLFCLDNNSASSATVGAGSAQIEKLFDAQTSVRVSTVCDGTLETGSRGAPAMVITRRELCAAAALNRASMNSVIASNEENSSASSADSPKAESAPPSHSKPNENDPLIEAPAKAATSSTPETKADDSNDQSDDMQIDVGSGIEVGASNSIPVILQRVLLAENGHVSHTNELLILAVHAVMLETGFATVQGSSLPSGWCRRGSVNLPYTLPEIDQGVEATNVGHVVLTCQIVGNNLVIYGTVTSGSPPPIYRLCLRTSKYLPAREQTTKGANEDPLPEDDLISCFLDLFGFWKCVKDELSLPLLTALCERAGLPVPLSLLRLPIELKMKILECLPALDLLTLGSTCSELRHLSANDDLWERLFVKEFGSSAGLKARGFQGWKTAFQHRFLERKRALERRMQMRRPYFGISSRFTPYRGFPRFGGIIGGDYDIYPSFGGGPFRGGLGNARGPSGGQRGVGIQPGLSTTVGMGTAGIFHESFLPGMDLLGTGSKQDGEFFD